jgi:hypothetical protein
MTFDVRGHMKNRCAFTEHCVEVNSGELAPPSRKEQEELAKRVANMTSGTEDVEAVDTEAVDGNSSSSGESSSGGGSDDLGL